MFPMDGGVARRSARPLEWQYQYCWPTQSVTIYWAVATKRQPFSKSFCRIADQTWPLIYKVTIHLNQLCTRFFFRCSTGGIMNTTNTNNRYFSLQARIKRFYRLR